MNKMTQMEIIEMNKTIMGYVFWTIMIGGFLFYIFFILKKSHKFGMKMNKTIRNAVEKGSDEYDKRHKEHE